ncbi:hypothetical protein HYPSUDRAFT_60531 [Hypholoma sublateritium FD-334 SS-4]|uniref:Cell division control protein 14 n=1 Tax=Hypholoma sublateritium (strain FD-334 SS-4) TaxID=945553 RepID=A0A0D2PG03_HYPSF|nr:hypothetical protein HYPSUDRAFT_60531 [Hypholoma sublateritium FD-334 SS-4]
MPLGDTMEAMRASLQSSLDDLVSPRASPKAQLKALESIEKTLAQALFITTNDSEAKFCFAALQYTFECNVPAHLLSWIIKTTAKLEIITNKGLMDAGQTSEAEELASHLALSLSLLQGTVLNHEHSKIYLGRKPALETLLDLLLVSRHLSTPQESAESKARSTPNSPHMTSIVLDTLLCILVDASAALRVFEAASGVQAIVKILKRAGTPREVRMKCLEFLYFYLLDETPTTSPDKSIVADLISSQPSPPPTAPATPVRPSKPYLSNGPKLPSSRYGSSTYSFSTSLASASLSISSSSTSSSRSTSSSSSKSFSSTSSNASSSTTASSVSASPVKESAAAPKSGSRSPVKRAATPGIPSYRQPPVSPPFSSAAKFPHLRSMMMLKKDVDFIPESPRKSPGFRPRHEKSLSTSSSTFVSRSSSLAHSRSRSQTTLLGSMDENGNGLDGNANIVNGLSKAMSAGGERNGSPQRYQDDRQGHDDQRKTTEQKKELLGTMLGNVDALVEGVRKAGIWGLPG